MKMQEFVDKIKLKPAPAPNLHLDTYAYCNARCIFCGYKDMQRKKGAMSRGLFHHIIDEVANWEQPMREINPVHYGEFFLNPDWKHILRYIQEKLPETRIAISTNGSQFDDEKIDKLVKIENIYWLNFSVYGFFDDTYQRLMGLNPDVKNQIEHAVQRIKNQRPDIRISVCTVGHPPFISELETKLFTAHWGKHATVHPIISNQDMYPRLQKNYPSLLPCPSIYTSLMILWDGRVSMCCYDPNGRNIVGDVKEESILDIWNGKRVREFQRLHAEGKRDTIPLCKTCTFACPLPPNSWR